LAKVSASLDATRASKSAAIKKHRERVALTRAAAEATRAQIASLEQDVEAARARGDHLGERAERLESDLRAAADAARLERVESEARAAEARREAEATRTKFERETRETFERLERLEKDLTRVSAERDRAEMKRLELEEKMERLSLSGASYGALTTPTTKSEKNFDDGVNGDADDSVSFVANTPETSERVAKRSREEDASFARVWKERVEEIQRELETANAALAVAESRARTAEAEVESLRAALNTARDAKEAADAARATATESSRLATEKVGEKQKALAAAVAEKANVAETLRRVTATLNETERERGRLSEHARSFSAKLERFTLEAREDAVKRADDEKAKQEKEHDALAEMERLQNALGVSTETCADLRNELEAIRLSVSETNARCEKETALARKAKEDAASARALAARLRRGKDADVASIKGLEIELAQLNAAYEKTRARAATASERVAKMRVRESERARAERERLLSEEAEKKKQSLSETKSIDARDAEALLTTPTTTKVLSFTSPPRSRSGTAVANRSATAALERRARDAERAAAEAERTASAASDAADAAERLCATVQAEALRSKALANEVVAAAEDAAAAAEARERAADRRADAAQRELLEKFRERERRDDEKKATPGAETTVRAPSSGAEEEEDDDEKKQKRRAPPRPSRSTATTTSRRRSDAF
jgi:chromosome segregation ATPase